MSVDQKPQNPITKADSADAAEQKAYRRGLSAGYSEGIAQGWDACMLHVKSAFETAISSALKEPEAVARHRAAMTARRAGQELANHD